MAARGPSSTREAVFDRGQVEAGFWLVFGTARGVVGEGGAGGWGEGAGAGEDEGGAGGWGEGAGAAADGRWSGGAGDVLRMLGPALDVYHLDDAARDGIARLIRATRAWVRGPGGSSTISASEFERTRRDLIASWGAVSTKGAVLWPPASRTVAGRLGGGRWNDALRALGVRTSSQGRERGRGTFSESDFRQAVAGYLAECDRRGGRASFGGYGSWARERRAGGEAVPAAATIRQHYGSWSGALAAAGEAAGGGWAEMPPEQ